MSGISKLIIKAYSDNTFGTAKGEFSASINPANIKITSSVNYDTTQGMGSPSMALRYNITPPRVLSFKLLFDNTGVIPDSGTDVKNQLDTLRSLVYDYHEDLNAPYYIRVIWGVIDFKGRLTGLETSYTMFQADGSPIRAEADITVLEEIDPGGMMKALKEQASAVGDVATPSGVGSDAMADALAASGGAAAGAAAGTAAASAANNNAAQDNRAATGDDAAAKGQDGNPNADKDAQGKGDNKAATASKNDANQAANKAGAATPNNSAMKQVKAGDSLPAISKQAFGDPNLSKYLGKLNGLDSLRGLLSGLKLALPFTLAGLLAMLIALAKKYGGKAKNAVKTKAKQAKEKTKAGAKKAKEKTKKGAQKTKEAAKKAKNKVKGSK